MVYRIVVFCCIWLNVLLRAKSKTTIISPSIQPVYLKSGGNLDLLCQQSDGFRVSWWKADTWGPSHNYRQLDSSKESGFFTMGHIDGMYHMRLTKENVSYSDSGSYKCSVESGTDMPFLVDVYVLQVERKDGLITHSGNTSSIGCSLQDSDIKATIRWFKSGMELARSSPNSPNSPTHPPPSSNPSMRSKHRVNTTIKDSSVESVLTVRNVGEADVGEYICMIELNEDYQFNHSVFVYSHPQIKPLGRSVNLVEGKVLDLTCRAWGWPVPNVTWLREVEDGSSPSSSSSSSSSEEWWMDERVSFPTDFSMRISSVVWADRAVYVCRASSFVFDAMEAMATASILVRIRGKFAPLLPLAGIFIEVVVLFVVIFFYERRRAVEREVQEREEATGNQPNSIAQGHRHSSAGEGRHRKLN